MTDVAKTISDFLFDNLRTHVAPLEAVLGEAYGKWPHASRQEFEQAARDTIDRLTEEAHAAFEIAAAERRAGPAGAGTC